MMKKKVWAILMAGLLCFSLCACAGSEEETASVTEQENITEDTEKQANIEFLNNGPSADTATDLNEQTQEEEAQAPAEDAQSVDLAGIYAQIKEQVALNSPIEPDNDFIYNYYGIDVNALDACVFSMAEVSTSAECIILIAPGASDASEIKELLETLRADKMAELMDYLPEQYQIVENSSVKEKNGIIYLVISENAEAIESLIEGAL